MTLPAWIWVNGDFRRGDEPALSALDRGLAFGDGLYETLRGDRGAPLFFEDHWARLVSSARALEIPLPLGAATLRAVLTELMARCSLAATPSRLKVILTRGPSAAQPWDMGCEAPTILATAWPITPCPARAVALGIVPHRRDGADPIWRHKTTNLLSRALARRALERERFDDGLILNTAGRVCEATTSNIFALLDGRVVTPPTEEGLLPGITRARLLRRLRETGALPAEERPLTLEDLQRAQAVWLTNAISVVTPVRAIAGREIPGDVPSAVIDSLTPP